jgi:hypothetical protein
MQVGIGQVSSKHTRDPVVLVGSRGWTRLRMKTSYLVVASCRKATELHTGALTRLWMDTDQQYIRVN